MLLAILLALPCNAVAQESVPLWKQGISTWNGNDYSAPTEQSKPIEISSLPEAWTKNADAPVMPAWAQPTPVPTQQMTWPSAATQSEMPAAQVPAAQMPAAYPFPTNYQPSLEPEPAAEKILAPKVSVPYTVPVDPSLNRVGMTNPYAANAKPVNPRMSLPALSQPQVEPVAVPDMELTDKMLSDTETEKKDQSESKDKELEQVQYAQPAVASVLDEPVIEAPPLQEETLRWYQYPWRWMTRGWDNHAEFGIDGSTGNAETLALQTGLERKRKTDDYILSFDFDYRFARNRSATTEDNGRLNIDYDRILNDSPWTLFGKSGIEYDQFKAFDLRLNFNAGVGYQWVQNDDTTFITRFGAGASQEIGAPIDDWIAEAVFGAEFEQQINRYNKIKAKLDYFPAWEDFSDFRAVTDLAWEILLDDEDNMSLRLAATDRYDSTPQGAQPNDLYYSFLLLFKF